VALALVAGGPIGAAIDGRSAAVRTVVVIGAWAGWAAGLVALLVPRDVALTALRTIVPAGLAAVVAAAAVSGEVGALEVAATALAAVATVTVLMPWVGEAWVDGSSYGSERRFPLRPPAALTYALVPLTWLVVVLGVVAGPLLLATGRWAIGAVALLVGAAAAVAGLRSLHQLARRWVVLVPGGLVVHDPLTMPEPQLVPRRMVARFGPAPADTDAHDLTAGAPGLALELELDEPVELLVRDGRSTALREARAVLLTPSRPRALLEAARDARLPVG
jgi:hypothetical protein